MDSEKNNSNISFFIPTSESARWNKDALVHVVGDLSIRITKQFKYYQIIKL